MTTHQPLGQDGLSQEELDQQEVAELPDREAMSVVNPNPGMPVDDGTVHILPYPYDPHPPAEPAPIEYTPPYERPV